MGSKSNALLLSSYVSLILSPFAAISAPGGSQGGHEVARSGGETHAQGRPNAMPSAARAPAPMQRLSPPATVRSGVGSSSVHAATLAPNHVAYGVAGERVGHGGTVVPGRDNSSGRDWRGGNWHGSYWPGSFRGPGFLWFLPVLPALYGVYYFGSVPYYYANNSYYLWSEPDAGYVAVDPPPLADGSVAAPAGVSVFMYPLQGQGEAQQSADRQACQDWANSQTGAAPSADDYRRAVVACATARGYSAN